MTHYGVIGMGPVGRVLACVLSRAGHRVSFVCRDQDRCAALLENPLCIQGAVTAEAQLGEGHTELPPFIAGAPERILICVKSSSSRALMAGMAAAGLPASTYFMACQNGMDVEELISEVFGGERTLRMVLNMGCSTQGANVVNVAFCLPHVIGAMAGCDPEVGKAMAADFTAAGFETRFAEDYRSDAFKKAILNASLGSVSALTRMTMSEVMHEPELYRMMSEIIREGIRIGRRLEMNIEDDFHQQALTYLSHGGNHKPSILVDIEHCRPTENEYHCGKLYRWSEALSLQTPVTQSIYYLLKNLERALRKGKVG